MTHFKHILFLLSAVLLSACTQEPQPAQAVEAQFLGAIQGGATRMAGEAWEPGDAIGVSYRTGGKSYFNVKYTTTGDGNFTFADEEGKRIFYNGNEEMTFSAYYPWCADGEWGIFRFNADTDLLFAKSQGSKSSPVVSLKFKHVLAKLSLTIRPGQGMDFTQTPIEKIETDFFVDRGVFNILSGIVNILQSGIKSKDVHIDSNDAPPVEMLYPPINTPFFTISIYISGNRYEATLPFDALEAGKNYCFTIRVNATGMNVSEATIEDWQTVQCEGVDATMPMPAPPKVGDYYYADGSYSTEPDASKTAIGRVFYAGRHPTDKSDYSRTPIGTNDIQGYVVSTKDAGIRPWSAYQRVFVGNVPKDEAGNILPNFGDNAVTDWSGYQYTQNILRHPILSTEKRSAAYCAAVDFHQKVPALKFTSGWFLPSIDQLVACEDFLPDYISRYWSSSEYSGDADPDGVDALQFRYAYKNKQEKSSINGVLPILVF